MYLPADLFDLPYRHLVKSRHAASPPVLLLVALEPDALCACRILTAILKRDYIPHNIVPVSGYGDLERAGVQHVQPMRTQSGGMGGNVICLGTGGMIDLASILGLESSAGGADGMGGVEVWVIDARRPWNLSNVFGGRPHDGPSVDSSDLVKRKALELDNGRIQHNFRPGKGGIIVFDDGDITQLDKEQEAYFQLEQMPDIDDDGQESDGSDSGSEGGDDPRAGQKRKSWSDAGEDDNGEDDGDDRPRQRRRSNSQESIPVTPSRKQHFRSSSDTLVPDSQPSPARSDASTIAPPSFQQESEQQPSMRTLRRRLLRNKRKHEHVLHAYYSRGSTYSEPISSLLYRLASDLGQANNDNLWLACVGVQSIEQYGRLSSTPISEHTTLSRDELVLSILRDEVNRLNAPDPNNLTPATNSDPDSSAIPTHAKSPTDTSIRLSPEPRLLLIRHWSLYESMLHSPYLAARLHLWSEPGRKRLHKLLAKMGVSLASAKQGYVHMDMDAKRQLRSKLLKYAPVYGLEGLLPPAGSSAGKQGWGFVRSWGWKACLSANDVGTILGAVLEVGQGRSRRRAFKSTAEVGEDGLVLEDVDGRLEGEEFVARFWAAYDALGNVTQLLESLPLTIGLHRAILRTGTSLLAKRQIRHLRAFRMGVVKEGPDVATFTHPGALTKLALWLAEAIQEQEKDAARGGHGKRRTPLVLASLNEKRGVYVVVGTGGGGGVTDMEERRLRRERLEMKKKEKEARARDRERKRDEKAAARAQRQADRGANDDDEEIDELDTESEASEDEDEEDDIDSRGLKATSNRFGVAFQEVVDEVGATTRIDNFENCVIEVKKEDLSGFLEALSMKAVIG